jgi:hypothetical protein
MHDARILRNCDVTANGKFRIVWKLQLSNQPVPASTNFALIATTHKTGKTQFVTMILNNTKIAGL